MARQPLTTERVLTAAISLADAGGIDSLSMRKLAHELGFEVMSLYNHVANKDEVIRGIVDQVVGEIDLAAHDADWKRGLRRTAVSAREVLLRHPWVLDVWWRTDAGPARLAMLEQILHRLHHAGLSEEVAHHGYHAILMHILGFTVQERNYPPADADIAAMAAEFLQQLPQETYPNYTRHVVEHVERTVTRSGFEFVLDLIIEGLERADHQD
jgi:AcrR family transcriptional regulator